MMKICLFATAIIGLALATGCATGGSGAIPPALNVNGYAVVYPNETVTYTATTGTMPPQPVSALWSLSGTACKGSGNPCGTIDPKSGVYQAPAAPPSPPVVTISATPLQSNVGEPGNLEINVTLIQVVVTPVSVNVGENLAQQFTAIAVPDQAPQTFTWACSTKSGSCSVDCGANSPTCSAATSVPPVFHATAPGSATVSATSSVTQTPAGVGESTVSVVSSQLFPSTTYAFQFSGYNSGDFFAAAGSFALGPDGAVTAGVEDTLTSGTPHQYTISGVSYIPSSNANYSNNLGQLTVTLSGVAKPNIYTAVLTSSGVFRLVETLDGTGITGSGIMQPSAKSGTFNASAQTYAFGFTGVDSNGSRVGYAGLLPMNGANGITGGLLDSNDNGVLTGVCSSPPCSINATGSGYSQPMANLPTYWNMTLVTAAGTQHFDFFVSAGTAQAQTALGSLTLYAISTDSVSAPTPALAGSMVYQVPMSSGYNNAAFTGTSVSNLTGLEVVNSAAVPNSSNVALINGSTDGTSSGTGGTGGFTGVFDQNDDGTIISVEPTPSNPSIQFTYTYVASSGNTGRYTFQMLGNPLSSPVVPSVPFVLYASGANRGFLLDDQTPAVMTGTMDPQPVGFGYAPSELPGIYAASTTSSSASTIAPVVQNLILTSTGGATYVVGGIQNPGAGMLNGTYTLLDNAQGPGTGSITLASPPSPAVTTNTIYALDTGTEGKNFVITDFWLIGTTSGTPSSLIFAQQ